MTILSAALPKQSNPNEPRVGPAEWREVVSTSARTLFQAAKETLHENFILGAWGCGSFGNPADEVAKILREQIESKEFRGAFRQVIFAIVDTEGALPKTSARLNKSCTTSRTTLLAP